MIQVTIKHLTRGVILRGYEGPLSGPVPVPVPGPVAGGRCSIRLTIVAKAGHRRLKAQEIKNIVVVLGQQRCATLPIYFYI